MFPGLIRTNGVFFKNAGKIGGVRPGNVGYGDVRTNDKVLEGQVVACVMPGKKRVHDYRLAPHRLQVVDVSQLLFVGALRIFLGLVSLLLALDLVVV